jgi:peroxiredoxin
MGRAWAAARCAIAWCAIASGVFPAAAASELATTPPEAGRYSLYEAGGTDTFTLDSLKGEWVALHFLLAVDCPYCTLHTQSFALQASTVPEARQVFIKPGNHDEVSAWAEQLAEEFAALDQEAPLIHRDPHAALARLLHIPHGYQYLDETMHHPALIIWNPDGEEVFRHIGDDTGDRIRFDQFVGIIAAMQRPFRIDAMNLPEVGVVAVGGYDPVAYFTEGEAIPGDPEISEAFHGILLRFANEAHREAFREEPLRYLPAYGGWCAMNMARGEQRDVDYTNFRIHDDRLYLFHRGSLTNARTIWGRDIETNIEHANKHWKQLTSKKTAVFE